MKMQCVFQPGFQQNRLCLAMKRFFGIVIARNKNNATDSSDALKCTQYKYVTDCYVMYWT